jgi:hypothetical protein
VIIFGQRLDVSSIFSACSNRVAKSASDGTFASESGIAASPSPLSTNGDKDSREAKDGDAADEDADADEAAEEEDDETEEDDDDETEEEEAEDAEEEEAEDEEEDDNEIEDGTGAAGGVLRNSSCPSGEDSCE